MSRIWITAEPSVDDTVAMLHRRGLRRSYRSLRSYGVPRWHARLIVSEVIAGARQEVKR